MPLQDTARTLGLHDWVSQKGFPLRDYCETVDEARRLLRRHQPDQTNFPVQEQIVGVIAEALDAEGALAKHALAAAYPIKDDTDWWKVCLAAAWQVMSRYEAAVEKGDWPSP